jgi:hypothetical protein
MQVEVMSDERFLIVDLLIKIIPLGLFIGLSIIFLMRWMKSRRNRVRERQVQVSAHNHEHHENATGEPKAQSHFYIIVLLDTLLFLYLLFSYEWSPGPGLSSSVGESLGAFIIVPIYYALISARFSLAVLFFTCLGGSIFMSRFYEGRWPQWFKLSCLSSFSIVLAWLLYRWGVTAWQLSQHFPSDIPHGLRDLLIIGLFSDCGGRLHNNDTAVSIGQSTGMYLLEWLAAIYLAEKYFRLATFQERRDEHGPAWWARFAPVVPVLLIIAFVGWGLWGNFQRERMVSQIEKMETVVLQPTVPHLLWHKAIEQCAAQGEGWRLPTTYELRLLSRGALASDSRLTAAWTGEVLPKYGPRDLRWAGNQRALPSYVPNVLRRCMSTEPTDLYQRLVVKLYSDLYQQHRSDSFHRYFFPDSPSDTLPTAVLCVKPTEQIDSESSSHLLKDAILVKDTKTATDLLKQLCDAKAYASNYCNAAEANRIEEARESDPVKSQEDFATRQEKCRLTADPEHCTGQGWYYLVRGEFDKTLVLYMAACQKGSGNACLEVDQIKGHQQRFAEVTAALVSSGYVATAPTRHREAKEPLILGCRQGHGEMCLYRGLIAEWEDKREDAKGYFGNGCTDGVLLSCTKAVEMESYFTMGNNTKALIVDKYVDICQKKEPLACLHAVSWLSGSTREQEGLALAKQRCAEGMQSLCEAYDVNTNPTRSSQPSELQVEDVRADSPYDIERFRERCRKGPINCKGFVNKLTLQAQFKEAEWFQEQACIHERAKDVKACASLISGKKMFVNMSQTLLDKKYITKAPENHASMVPVLKKACDGGVAQACIYIGDLMLDLMQGHFEGDHPLYTRAGLIRPFDRACQLGVAQACKHALDLVRQWREGQHLYAERENYPRAATTEETRAYARLCEERNYAGACWEVLLPWIDDKNQDHRQIPDALAPVWRYTERLCEKDRDTVACWTLLKPWIDYLEHDHSKLPQDRTSIRRQLERLCKIESEDEDSYKRACKELQRYLDLHWL